MKKLVVLVGDMDNRSVVAETLIKSKVVVGVFSVYGQVEEVLSETFKKSISKNNPSNFDIQLTENHLRLFFSKMVRGTHAVTNYVGKQIHTTGELIDYFVSKVGAHAWGQEFLYKAAAESFSEKPAGVYVAVDLEMEEAKKLKSLLPNQVSIVQITTPEQEHEEGLPFFAFDSSDESWKKSVIKMFKSLNEKSKENVNGKQRLA